MWMWAAENAAHISSPLRHSSVRLYGLIWEEGFVVVSRLSMSVAVLAFAFVSSFAIAEDAAPAAGAPAAAGAAPAAPVQLPPWMSTDVLKAAVAINMTDAQKPEFNKAVGEYVTDHFAMIQKVMKVGAPNVDMTIRSKDNALVHKLDDKVEKILTKEQLPAYEDYKKVLRAGLHP